MAKPFPKFVCTKLEEKKNKNGDLLHDKGHLLKKRDPHHLVSVNNFSRCHYFFFLIKAHLVKDYNKVRLNAHS